MASWRADTVLECTAVSFMIYDILHRSVVVQLDSFALGVGAKVCIISLSLSLHIDMYSSLSTMSVSRVALPRYTPPKPAHQSDQ